MLWHKRIEMVYEGLDGVPMLYLVIADRKIGRNQLMQLCTARTVFSILANVRLYTVMPEMCRSLTNEKQRETDIRLTDQ